MSVFCWGWRRFGAERAGRRRSLCIIAVGLDSPFGDFVDVDFEF